MSDTPDANYCTSCGAELPDDNTGPLFADLILNVYRQQFVCPVCDYFGEIIRHGVNPDTGRQRETTGR